MRASSSWLIALGLAALLTGCESTVAPTNPHIGQNPKAFATLDSDAQKRVRTGAIQPGDTVEMARLALGEPDKITSGTGPDGRFFEIWYYHVLERTDTNAEIVNYTNEIDHNIVTGAPIHYKWPEHQTTSRTLRRDAFKLLIHDGKVLGIRGVKAAPAEE